MNAAVDISVQGETGRMTFAPDDRTTSAAGRGGEESPLLLQLLREQQSLTAVDVFSRECDLGQLERVAQYRALLPSAVPGTGEQYAFEVDLDRCSGCKACVAACHALNGLDEEESWRDVGLLVGGSRLAPVAQHVTASCHHCLEPACLVACPVNAYEKDSATGIVKHLDDQCIGCQYCTLACPYEVPRYHAQKGIVRKCDMCSARLAVGEAPACVQACPNQAIAIKVASREQIAEDAEVASFLPAAPDPQITLPATSYKTRRALPKNLLPADYYRVSPQHAHLPLAIMLVLTQLSVGAFAVSFALTGRIAPVVARDFAPMQAVSALLFGGVAIAASVLHLGRPRYAFRAVLGLRHSWLSREIAAFGLFTLLAISYAIAAIAMRGHPIVLRWLGGSVVVSGASAVACSAMVYVFTRRECWSATRVGVRFLLTSILLGTMAVWLSLAGLAWTRSAPHLAELVRDFAPRFAQVVVSVSAIKLLWEAALFRHLFSRRMTPLKRSALLMTRDLSSVALARFATGALGGLLMPYLLLRSLGSDFPNGGGLQFGIVTMMLFAGCLAGELLERYLFFTAAVAPRMPGGIR